MVTKLAHVERERAIQMLKARVTPLIVAKQFRCHVRTIGRLKNRFQQIGQRHTVCVQGVDGMSRLRHPDVSFVQLISFSQSQLGPPRNS